MVKNGWGKRPQVPPETSRIIINDSSNTQGIIETIQNSLFDITNEIAKVQPRYAQSVSNFQAEYQDTTRMIIQTIAHFQSIFVKFSWNNFDSKSSFMLTKLRIKSLC